LSPNQPFSRQPWPGGVVSGICGVVVAGGAGLVGAAFTGGGADSAGAE